MQFVSRSARSLARQMRGARAVLFDHSGTLVRDTMARSGAGTSGPGVSLATDDGGTGSYERMREGIQRLIDSIESNVAILDPDGRIDMVNIAWSRFARENGAPDSGSIGPGANHFSACRPGDVVDGDFARRAVDGIRGVLDRRLPVFSMEHPCHSPGCERWFVVVAAPFGSRRALVSHVDVTPLPAARRAP